MDDAEEDRKRSRALLSQRDLQDRMNTVSEKLRSEESALIEAHQAYDRARAELEALYAERGQVAGCVEAFKAIDEKIRTLELELDDDWKRMRLRSANQFEFFRELSEMHEHQKLLLGRIDPASTT